MPKRTSRGPKLKWTNKMLEDAIKCKEKALALVASSNPPRRVDNGRKIGYMEIMLNLWNQEGYDYLNLSKQNLSDVINQAERRKHKTLQPLAEIIANERTQVDDQANVINDIPQIANNQTSDDSVVSVESDCKDIPEILEKATTIFNDINKEIGDFSTRRWRTKLKSTPLSNTVNVIDIICKRLFQHHTTQTPENTLRDLWNMNCIVYSAVVAWLLYNDVKGIVVSEKSERSCNSEPKWLLEINAEIKETRKFISQCVAERERLKSNGRMTRKTRRNRKTMQKCLNEGERISCVSLTVTIEKNKNKLKNLAKSRKRKIKNADASKINKRFKMSQKGVYNEFKQILEESSGEETPTFKKVGEKERQVFENVEEVVNFWAGIWEKNDSGNAHAEWIEDVEKVFKEIIPDVNENPIPITQEDIYNSIKKKKNWSAPGPDLIVNYWWKKLKSCHPVMRQIVNNVVNEYKYPDEWFSIGKVSLIPKEDKATYDNQRPITCTNNLYKWYTSVLLLHTNNHLEKYKLMQIDQRGAKKACSGTTDNLLLDDTIIRDAIMHNRNLSCAWLDVRKAFDSLSHSYLKRVIAIHMLPTNLMKALYSVMEKWYVRIEVPTSKGTVLSRLITFSNGELQGDSLGPTLYTLAKNPISWKIRQRDGYVLSSPIKEKITHSLFIDDLKKYDRSPQALVENLECIKGMMEDAGLQWNKKKCKCVHLKRGKHFVEDLTLSCGFKLQCLESVDSYKFLGVPESVEHDISNLCMQLLESIRGRANIVWSSPLSDFNKVIATNTFVNSTAEYFFWSEKFRIDDLKKMDICIRKAMVVNGAKHYQQMNDVLYLSKAKGGRGLRSFEQSYKETKIKATIKLLETTDERVKLVTRFNRNCLSTSHASIFKDGINYASDIGISLEIDEDGYSVSYEKKNEIIISKSLQETKDEITRRRDANYEEEIFKSNWQGVNFKTRKDDTDLESGCYDWLKTWQNAPTNIVREIYDLYCQTLNTKAFQIIRSECPPTDTVCRLCKNGNESVMHVLNRCKKLLKKPYTRRHNQALKCFFYEVLKMYGFLQECPPWFTQKGVKPYYNNETATVWWDIPEFAESRSDIEEEKVFRPDGKIKVKQEKKIYLVEITISWIDNREARFIEKSNKYEDVKRNIRRAEEGFEVDQITLVMDSLGGYSKNLSENIAKIIKDRKTVKAIINKMQKAVLCESTRVARCFKLGTQT